MKVIVGLAARATVLMACVVVASAQQPTASKAKSFGFMGGQVTILQSGADTGGSSALLDIHVPANGGPPPHIHTREDEVYLVKSGTFQFFMDGMCRQAGPGATMYMPKGRMHAFKNIATVTGEQLLFVYPAGVERFFREVHDLDLKMPEDFKKLNELSNTKYGINHVPDHDFHAGACTIVGTTDASAK